MLKVDNPQNDIRSILRDGADLVYYRSSGSSSALPIVFVHGWAGSAEDWSPIFNHYAAQGVTCLAYDAVGFGRSQFPSKQAARQADFSIERYTDDLLALLDSENLAQVRLVGHSWGGVIAMAFAERYPARVNSLVAIGAAYYDPQNWLHVLFKWISWLMAWLIVLTKPLLRRSQSLRRIAVRRYTFKPLSQSEGDEIMHHVLASDNRAIVQTLLTGYAVRFKQLCPALRVPVLYVACDKDVVAPKQFVTPFVALTPASRYALLADCGHFPMLETPSVLRQTLDNFWTT